MNGGDTRTMTDLTGSVDNVTIVLNALVANTLVECTLDCWIVSFDEVVFYELYDKRRFACWICDMIVTAFAK